MLEVVVAVIVDALGRILISRRGEHTHLAGYWEFPGGKVEAGESLTEALSRELYEELGIQIQTVSPFCQIKHHYPQKTVRLNVFYVTRWQGSPHGREGQPLQWSQYQALSTLPFPEANTEIIRRLSLPQEMAITPEKFASRMQWAELFRATQVQLAAGIKLFQLRLPDLSEADFSEVGMEMKTIIAPSGGLLFANWNGVSQYPAWADGVHLTSSALMRLSGLASHKVEGQWAGASCHNVQELERAVDMALDYVLISPVRQTPSHPGAVNLGWENFKALSDQCWLPSFALGGVMREDRALAIESGAYGVAGISGFWH